ncbi:hypothetical protein ACHAXA_004743 [Cyclostephanos tholiformis]|uniref:Integrase catalytic domain-containing protein n=1 Tax=Cyclostephanos tholiformis TaxID=382380 RepID=A0ABD3SSP4_9STRA
MGAVEGIKQGLEIKGIGTFKFKIEDDDGRTHEVKIKNSLYLPELRRCLLSPQHWAQEAGDNHPLPRGTRMENDDANCILFWGQGKYKKTIPHNPDSNVPILHTAASALTYRAFATTFEAMEANFYRREHVRQLPGLRRHEQTPDDQEFIADENVHFNGAKRMENGVSADDETIKMSKVTSPSEGEHEGQTRMRALTFDPSPPLEEEEEVHLAAADDQAELMRWHYRLGHLPFARLKLLAKNGEVPRRLAKVPPPKCAGCLFGAMTKVPWRGRESKTSHEVFVASKPGECVSVDHMVSTQAGFYAQLKGKLTNKRYRAASVFVDHFSRIRFVHLMQDLSSEETIKAKLAFEQFAAEHGVKIKHYHCDNGRFADTAFKQSCEQNGQRLTFCGVNAHFQNGIAERAIRDLSESARKQLLHARHRWPAAVHVALWPYALRNAALLHNNLPTLEDGTSRLELFSSIRVEDGMGEDCIESSSWSSSSISTRKERAMKEGPPELMSPAGGWSQLRAAVSNGADAVYLGLKSYSARARATNFDPNPELIFRRHRRRPGEYGEFDDEYDDDEQDESTNRVRVYVAFNTLVFDDKLSEVEGLIENVWDCGVDAVIVQDVGVSRIVREVVDRGGGGGMGGMGGMGTTNDANNGIVIGRGLYGAPMEIHASTQQTVTCADGVAFAANRTNATRVDLCGLDQVEGLVRVGVSCLKIEGRLKDASYVAATTRAYRQAIDAVWDKVLKEQGDYHSTPPRRILSSPEEAVSRSDLTHPLLLDYHPEHDEDGHFDEDSGEGNDDNDADKHDDYDDDEIMLKGTNYSLEEIDSLLDLIEDELPISATLWENIQKSHLSRYPDQRRGVDSIKRKFKELYSKRVKTGDPNCPQEVCRAKRLRHQNVESMNASDLNTVVAGSEEQGSESGDDLSSVLGEHDNIGSDVVVAHRTRRSSAELDDVEEEDDDDLVAEVVDEVGGNLGATGGAGEDDAAEAIAAEFLPRESTTSSTSTARQGQRRGEMTSRRRAAVHLTPISRPQNRQRGERDESPEGRPGDQISQMIAIMMMNQGADREERRVEREERREEFRLQLEMQRQQMQAQQSQQNIMTMMMMSMLGRNGPAQNENENQNTNAE